MDVKSIVNQICDEADDFLAGVGRRDEAKAGIAEWLTMHHVRLPAAEKKAVIEQAMRVLDNESFFEGTAGGSNGNEDDLDGFEPE
jgi:hypothetical protein